VYIAIDLALSEQSRYISLSVFITDGMQLLMLEQIQTTLKVQ